MSNMMVEFQVYHVIEPRWKRTGAGIHEKICIGIMGLDPRRSVNILSQVLPPPLNEEGLQRSMKKA